MAATVRFPTRPLSIAHHLLCPALHDLTLWLYVLYEHYCVVNSTLSSVLLTWQRSQIHGQGSDSKRGMGIVNGTFTTCGK